MKFSKINLGSNVYLIDENYNFVINEGFNSIEDIGNNLFIVVRNKFKKYNIVNSNGEFIFQNWFDRILKLDGVLYVYNKDMVNIIKSDNNLLSDEWFKHIEKVTENIFLIKNKNKKENLIDINGKKLLNEYVDVCFKPSCGIVMVKKSHNINYININNGNYLFDIWFDNGGWDFECGYTRVEYKNKYNFIDAKGNFIFEKWFDGLDLLFNEKGFVNVRNGEKLNQINKEGKLFYKTWVDLHFPFKPNPKFHIVEINEKRNITNDNGDIISNVWFDNIKYHTNNEVVVELNGQWNIFNFETGLKFSEWRNIPYV